MRRLAIAALFVFVATASATLTNASSAPVVKAATLRDPANDVPAADLDFTSVSLAKRSGNLITRFSVRGPVTNNVSYTADIGYGVAFVQIVAKRTAGKDSFWVDAEGVDKVSAKGTISGRIATVIAPISGLRLGVPLERVRAYFWSQPTGPRWSGKDVKYWSQPTDGRSNGNNVDWAPQLESPTQSFCLSDKHPRPHYGPCIWPSPGSP